MKNPRFIKGDIDTHFIEEETGLIEDIKAVLEQEQILSDKLPLKFTQKARVAAIAASALLSQVIHQQRQGTKS
jgi:pyruvate carboxylase subunit A